MTYLIAWLYPIFLQLNHCAIFHFSFLCVLIM
jgi:hypothetical protein